MGFFDDMLDANVAAGKSWAKYPDFIFPVFVKDDGTTVVLDSGERRGWGHGSKTITRVQAHNMAHEVTALDIGYRANSVVRVYMKPGF